MRSKKLAVFFTDGMSLKKWHDVGTLEREVATYNKLAESFEKIYFISYGDKTELNFKAKVKSNIEICYKKIPCPNLLYQFLIPFSYWNILKNCNFWKTNQIYGSIPAILSKILFRKGKLIIRSGYIASLNAKLYKQSFFSRLYTRSLEFIAYKICNRAFITTEENRNYILKHYKFLRSKIDVINNPIDLSIFQALQVNKEYDIGYVGRLNKDKNLLNLLRATKGLNIKVCFIGNGEEKSQLLDYAKQNEIDLKIIERIDNYDLVSYYNSFKIFVFPSLHEGNPKSLLEAMACALPVIGCKVVGVKNIVKNEVNGLISDTECECLREKIEFLLNNEKIAKKLGTRARSFVQKWYDFEKIILKEREIYEKLN